jgi:hypothetical protein
MGYSVFRNDCFLPVLKGAIYKNSSCSSDSCVVKPGRNIPSNSFIRVECKDGYDITEYDYDISLCLKSNFIPALPNCSSK